MKFRNSDILTLLLLTAPAALLQSCTYHDKIVINERHEIVIGVASAGTKSIIDNEDGSERLADMVKQCFNGTTLKENAGFGVFGFKKVIETSSLLFDNQLVHPDPTSYSANAAAHTEQYTDWVYSPLRFWDLTASYQFIGYWPYSAATSGNGFYVTTSVPDSPTPIEDAHKQIILHNVPNWQLVDGTEKDIMTATSVGRYNPDYSFLGSVRMSFRHVLSQLVVKAYYVGKEKTDGVTINGITLSEYTPQGDDETAIMTQLKTEGKIAQAETTFKVLDETKSTITQRYDNQPSFAPSLAIENQLQSFSNSQITFKDEMSEDVNYINNFTPTTVARWLVVPHVWYKLNMTIDYQIGNENKQSSPIPVALAEAESGYFMKSGSAYILTLVFNTTGGGFTVEPVAVKNWNNIEVEKEFYNW